MRSSTISSSDANDALHSFISQINPSDALSFAIASLSLFVQSAYTGPLPLPISLSQINQSIGWQFENENSEQQILCELMNVDGEDVYPLTPYLVLLILAIRVLERSDLQNQEVFFSDLFLMKL